MKVGKDEEKKKKNDCYIACDVCEIYGNNILPRLIIILTNYYYSPIFHTNNTH